MPNLVTKLFCVTLAVGGATQAHAAATWNWLRAEPQADGKGWIVHQGQANFDIGQDDRFKVELDVDSSTLRQHYQLEGRIRHGRVDATEILLNSDAGRQAYTGVGAEGLLSDTARLGVCIHLHGAASVIALCKETP